MIPFGTPGSGGYPQDYISSTAWATGDGMYGPNPNSSDPTSSGTSDDVPASQYGMYAIGIIVILIAYKFLTEAKFADMEVTDVRIGIHNVVAVTIMAAIGIASTKILVNKYPAPTALKNLVNTL